MLPVHFVDRKELTSSLGRQTLTPQVDRKNEALAIERATGGAARIGKATM